MTSIIQKRKKITVKTHTFGMLLGLPLSLFLFSSLSEIFIEVDNVLYDDPGISSQIIKNINAYCSSSNSFNLTAKQAFELHDRFGSTVHGLNLSTAESQTFYDSVFSNLDLSTIASSPSSSSSPSGYSHNNNKHEHNAILPFLTFPSPPGPRISLASNSPLPHLNNILQHLNLPPSLFHKILTPSLSNNFTTKSSPSFFPNTHTKEFAALIDDSQTNLNFVKKHHPNTFKTFHAPRGPKSLLESLLTIYNLTSPSFEFNSTRYLQSKNQHDEISINRTVFSSLLSLLKGGGGDGKELVIADLGAGLLPMLHRLKRSGAFDNKTVVYHAYEPNVELEEGIKIAIRDHDHDHHHHHHHHRGLQVVLHAQDFKDDLATVRSADLIVGCCFADLFEPRTLLNLLRPTESENNKTTLVYFPLTYMNSTSVIGVGEESRAENIGFDYYNRGLETQHNQHTDGRKLLEALQDSGEVISSGGSNFVVGPNSSYFYECLLDFFGRTGGVEMLRAGLNGGSWLEALRGGEKSILIKNVDVLGRLRGGDTPTPTVSDTPTVSVQFTAPREIKLVQSPSTSLTKLEYNQVEIKSIASLISSGTELKMYRGDFEQGQRVDSSIEGMGGELSYPFNYGYSLVGSVVRVNEENKEAKKEFLGKVVFAFANHASSVVQDLEGVQVVPEGVGVEDAVFLPAVETALSLVMDGKVILGEDVGVVGCGMIGLLVCRILRRGGHRVVAYDLNEKRSERARQLGCELGGGGGGGRGGDNLDCAIEVSGCGGGLQKAIDIVGDHGRVVVGSLYGGRVELELGLGFHRSGKSLKGKSEASRRGGGGVERR